MRHAVVLVTDYGWDDAYAAALVGACWRIDASLRVRDGTHGVPPGDVLAGAYHVKSLARAFPAGTVVCAVVDPGVGTGRGAIAVEAGGVRCVAPDNGLVTWLWSEAAPGARACVSLPVPADASSTFHGRDVFAPAAARLAQGASLGDLGEPLEAPELLETAFAQRSPGGVLGRVAVVDHFGNAITTIRAGDLGDDEPAGAAWPSGATWRAAATYAEIGPGLAVLLGGSGHLEVAADGRPASALQGPGRGDEVLVHLAAGGRRTPVR